HRPHIVLLDPAHPVVYLLSLHDALPICIKVRSAGQARPVATVELSFTPPGDGERFEVASLLVRVDMDGYVFHFANLTQDQLERLTLLVRRLASSFDLG